jgi:TIR domain
VVRIFLSYAREDEAQVSGVYRRLLDAGFEVWMDKINLLPGQRWQQEIPLAIRNSDFILIFFSKNSITKRGYIQREFRLALDTLEEIPPDAIHTIPIRLDDCQIPEQFHHLQWSDLSEAGEFDRIVQALQWGMEQRQAVAPEPALEPPPDPLPHRGRTGSGGERRSNAETPVRPTEELELSISNDNDQLRRASLEERRSEELSVLRQQMIAARSEWELEEVLYKVEEFLSRDPGYPEARVLRSRIMSTMRSPKGLPKGKAPSLLLTILRILVAGSAIFLVLRFFGWL